VVVVVEKLQQTSKERCGTINKVTCCRTSNELSVKKNNLTTYSSSFLAGMAGHDGPTGNEQQATAKE
jgi:hypothetical protein